MAAKKENIKLNPKPKNQTKRLFRSSNNRVFAGICGGLGEFFDIDATLIRLIFILITVFGGGGILVYIILWLIIPEKNKGYEISDQSIKENAEEIKTKAMEFANNMKINSEGFNSRGIFGIIILLLGILFLLSNFGLFRIFQFHKFWPLILVFLGVLILSRSSRE